jgi:very-short-patch-repair endonuclease
MNITELKEFVKDKSIHTSKKTSIIFIDDTIKFLLKEKFPMIDICWDNRYEILHLLNNDLDQPKICSLDECSNYTTFRTSCGYGKFCSRTCSAKFNNNDPKMRKIRIQNSLYKYGTEYPMQSKSVKEKTKKTNIERYGVENTFMVDKFKDKAKKTLIEKYGVEYAFQSEKIKEKIKQTNLERYGTEHIINSEEIKEKIKQTNLERYGAENVFQSEEIKEKIKQTNLERYGVENAFQSEDIRNKAKSTMIEKYGVDHPMKSEEIKNKFKNTNIERYGVEYPIRMSLNNDYVDVFAEHNKDEFKRLLYEHGTYELAELVNCHVSNIHLVAKKYDIPLPPRNRSNYEKKLLSILESHNIEFIGNNRSIIPPKELDFYIPSAKLAIEINGLYYHSDKFKDKNYHYNKWKECHENGIQLLSIMEDEFIDRPNTWISKILHICNQNKERIHARKCKIIEINKDQVCDFVEKYHLQGFVASSHYYGAYYDNELVAMMSFANTRNNKEIQMNRFCLKNGVVISGIANRLLKAYITDYDIDEIVTYSDNRYSNGGVYRQMGFEIENTIPPDYSYVKNMQRFHKSGFKKDNIASKFGIDMANKTEREAMEELGFIRIYDCGKVKWKYKKEII